MALSTSLGQIVDVLRSLQARTLAASTSSSTSSIAVASDGLQAGETLSQSEALSASTLARTDLTHIAYPEAVDADTPIVGISTDSRSVKPGELFLALSGERFDGHAFVERAFAQGAIAAIVNPHKLPMRQEDYGAHLLLPVANTLSAYQAIANWWRHQCSAKIIAVTGSVGKTTTKELIAAVLAPQGSVLKTQANYNNEIGVPKTLLELDPSHRFAVIEMGMRAAGEIADLTRVAQPDIAVITNVGTAHIGLLGSEAAIARAKCELLLESPPGSTAILNAEDSRLLATAQQLWTGNYVTFGIDAGSFQGVFIAPNRLHVDGTELLLPLPGRHNAVNFMAALAVARALGLDWRRAASGLKVELPNGRAQQYWLAEDVLVLDETYNAGVESMTAALHLLADTPGKRHVAILGTMKELGDRSVALHEQVGTVVHALNLDEVLILADPSESQALARGSGTVSARIFKDGETLAQYLSTSIQAGDRLLFKASRAVGLEQVIRRVKDLWQSNGATP